MIRLLILAGNMKLWPSNQKSYRRAAFIDRTEMGNTLYRPEHHSIRLSCPSPFGCLLLISCQPLPKAWSYVAGLLCMVLFKA